MTTTAAGVCRRGAYDDRGRDRGSSTTTSRRSTRHSIRRWPALGVTKGLSAKYPDRVLDTPISESSFIGAAAGAACSGLRPVADAVEIETAHLVGHSMGGAVALQVAADHPDRVASLALIDSAGLSDDINADYIESFLTANRRRELKGVLQLLFANPDLVTRQLVDDVLKYKRKDGVDDHLLGNQHRHPPMNVAISRLAFECAGIDDVLAQAIRSVKDLIDRGFRELIDN